MTTQSTVEMRRLGIPAIVTLAAMATLAVLTADAAARQAGPAPPTEATAPRDAGEPIIAIVSIMSQQVTFYDADGWILRAPVSTGTTGRETPAGVFAIIEKDKDHHSTLYDDAWMPNMQRITWNGIALHGGPLPGYAASHGCVRMPYDFAEKLFDKTWIGMRVIIFAERRGPGRVFPPGAIRAERGGRRGCSGACRDARSRGRGGRQNGRRGEENTAVEQHTQGRYQAKKLSERMNVCAKVFRHFALSFPSYHLGVAEARGGLVARARGARQEQWLRARAHAPVGLSYGSHFRRGLESNTVDCGNARRVPPRPKVTRLTHCGQLPFLQGL